MMLGVVRAGRCLRVILDGEDWKTTMTHAFHTVVVEIDVRDFDFGREAFSLNGEAVVVRRDLDRVCLQVFDGLIAAAMAEA